MKITIDTKSLDKVRKKMDGRADKVKGAIKTIISKSIFLVERYGKIEAPVRTGRLRASIGGGSYSAGPGGRPPAGSFPEGEGIEIGDRLGRIGPTVTYAKYVHVKNPFMTRGAQEAVPEIKRVAQEEINKAIQ